MALPATIYPPNSGNANEAPSEWFDVTLDADLTQLPRALSCTTSGLVEIVSEKGVAINVMLTAGLAFSCRPVRVNSVGGSTVAGVVALL
jgi:hypothetical protein